MTTSPPVSDTPRLPQRANGIARYQHLLDTAETLLARDGSGALSQVIGKRHNDLAVMQMARAYEQATQWVQKNPPPMI